MLKVFLGMHLNIDGFKAYIHGLRVIKLQHTSHNSKQVHNECVLLQSVSIKAQRSTQHPLRQSLQIFFLSGRLLTLPPACVIDVRRG